MKLEDKIRTIINNTRNWLVGGTTDDLSHPDLREDCAEALVAFDECIEGDDLQDAFDVLVNLAADWGVAPAMSHAEVKAVADLLRIEGASVVDDDSTGRVVRIGSKTVVIAWDDSGSKLTYHYDWPVTEDLIGHLVATPEGGVQ